VRTNACPFQRPQSIPAILEAKYSSKGWLGSQVAAGRSITSKTPTLAVTLCGISEGKPALQH